MARDTKERTSMSKSYPVALVLQDLRHVPTAVLFAYRVQITFSASAVLVRLLRINCGCMGVLTVSGYIVNAIAYLLRTD